MNKTVIINLGTPVFAKKSSNIDENASELMAGLIIYTLKQAIEKNCVSWNAMGKKVSIYADEIKLLADTDTSVLEWFKDAGRSSGVNLNFATQRLEQLDIKLQNSIRTFGTLISFRQSQKSAEILSGEFLLENNDDTIVKLDQYIALVRLITNKQLPAFTYRANYYVKDNGEVDISYLKQ
jgi:hypothetical protein